MTLPKLALSLAVAVAALGGCAIVDKRADKREAQGLQTHPPIGQFVEVDGRRVHAYVTGQGPDLVLIHGASGNVRDWTLGFIDAVKDNYRVIAFDRPGLGYTDRLSDEFGGAFNTAAESPRQQARMLKAAADQLGVERPIVLGHSYGGAVAMAWGLEFPDHARGIVNVSGATMPWPGSLDTSYRINASSLGGATVVPLITAFAPVSAADDVVSGIFAPQDPPEGYADHLGLFLTIRRSQLRANARQVNSLRPHVVEMSAHYADIQTPVEILHGTADTIVPLTIHSEPLAALLPNARLTRLEGIGHMPQHTSVAQIVEAIGRLR
ncbi:alpha/beta fold hydrolase [Nereida sp. MMG025]|uniref:alpha/beta fold hydrolase n=1 Tax=Nereida sp. MMG025 TaxID=2909981 RepID=UPI001F1F48AA|nr:alpha/beta hydrolase [Nereida sp. MMG025]MCF6443250.1 alpha/beta hydrolase [Nereida sp. MMG025]